MLVVPEAFANAAMAMFTSDVSILNDADAGAFYDDRAHVREPAVKENLEVLQAISVKKGLGIAPNADDAKALDPTHPAAGRRNNKLKTWTDFKTHRGITMRP